MIVLALDTCDARGSLAILRDDEVLHVAGHDSGLDYSSWLLPATESALAATRLQMADIELLAVAAGPGSFTGLRIGLTTVKAWGEVYGTRIAAVSRLEVLASQAAHGAEIVAAFVGAQRGQIFGGLYRREAQILKLIEQEMVIAPEEFLAFVEQHAARSPVSWISLDPEKITALARWAGHAKNSEQIQLCEPMLAPIIGRLGRQRALEGRMQDALSLDAEYVRRSDAEIFWKGGVKRGA
ncbi:MAG TPA: tRNA (adenosine(37)-N6)-threonylcarbamoyltransferase complex dimerization subunit type 1 TsaB [Candidatus Methylomirabilis sp.]|nr:tRNA (adenosine(37)-N6)-threonylcarbamoyltransferase complex dimerization subunit type 1 TsaB [Candidatus Methylomirabilis sp.]